MGMVANGQYASAGVLQANGVATPEGDDSGIETAKATVNETQLLMRELSGDGPLTEVHVQAVAGECCHPRSLELVADQILSPSFDRQSLALPSPTTPPSLCIP